jgi:agmatinase
MHNALSELPQVHKLVQVGVRDLSAPEHGAIVAEEKISTIFEVDRQQFMGEGEPWANLAAEIIERLPDKVYVSLDIDGLDPTYCPNTGTPVPGGLTFAEVVQLLGQLGRSGKTIVGFDLVEVAPGPGPPEESYDANVGARLLYKLCGWALRGRSSGKGEV